MTSPRIPGDKPILYHGEPLDPERGPGLGCFWLQVVVLVFFIVITPLSVAWGWPSIVSAALLFAVIGLLLVAGQTIIFLLRLVAADRREGRRRPLASRTPTVGEIEGAAEEPGATADEPDEIEATAEGPDDSGETETGGVRE